MDGSETGAPRAGGSAEESRRRMVVPSNTVLIVEDNKDWQNVLSRAVERMGYNPVVVERHQEAKAKIQELHPFAIISDLNLYDPDPLDRGGYDLLRDIKTEGGPPAIVVTGYASPEHIRRARAELDVVDFLEKSDFEESRLLEALQAAFTLGRG